MSGHAYADTAEGWRAWAEKMRRRADKMQRFGYDALAQGIRRNVNETLIEELERIEQRDGKTDV